MVPDYIPEGERYYLIKVLEWDFDNGDGTFYEPTFIDRLLLDSPFHVRAESFEEALGNISDNVGWLIMDAVEI